MRTLRENLEASVLRPTSEEFNDSRDLNPLNGGSWAVWGEITGDLNLFKDEEAMLPRLRKDVVLIAANFGLSGEGEPGEFKAFQNFHAVGSVGDSKLRNALVGTPLEGAYLTDIVKNYATAYANGLKGELKSGVISEDAHVVEPFLAEQRALGLTEDTLYIPVGKWAREIWDYLAKENEVFAKQNVIHESYAMPFKNMAHYSGPVNLVKNVEQLLDFSVKQ